MSGFFHWVIDFLKEIVAFFKGVVVLLLLISAVISAIWWWTGDSSEETTVYNASCTNFTPILPSYYSIDMHNFEKTYEQYRKTRAECGLLAAGSNTYKINTARAEVYYVSLGRPERLVDCAVFDNNNWRCAYSDDSGHVTVAKGLKAIEKNYDGFSFSMHRYQWWYVHIYWLIFSKPPRGEWLIPEQEVA